MVRIRSALASTVRRLLRLPNPSQSEAQVQRVKSCLDVQQARLVRIEQLLFGVVSRDVEELGNLLEPVASAHSFKRIGDANDGGYVVVADIAIPDCAISIGVGNECSADDALAAGGTTVWQFDHTVEASPSNLENVTFRRLGLGTRRSPDVRPLADLLDLVPLEENESVWLLLDAEGVEWDLLSDLEAPLGRFEQIVIEFHLLSLAANPRVAFVFREGLVRLRETHIPVAWHINNFAPVHVIGGKVVPDVVEATFVSREVFKPGSGRPDKDLFSPNNPWGPKQLPAPFTPVGLSPLGVLPEILKAALAKTEMLSTSPSLGGK